MASEAKPSLEIKASKVVPGALRHSRDVGTDDAFETLVTLKTYWERTGLPDGMRRKYLHRITTGTQGITLDRKIELLKAAGFGIKQEMTWFTPDPIKAV